ncbi:MAG: hypothetical protein JST82_16115 [Bacteroidetes bacterium]|nr:hypothetical protein [Bacteroidota bacterium]
MRILTIICLLCFSLSSGAQHNNNPIANFNSDSYWQKTRLIHHLPAYAITNNDTPMVVISNRKLTDDSIRYMSESRCESGVLYFFVFTHNGIWNVLPVPSLEVAIQYMPDKNRDWVAYTEGMGKLFTTDLNRGLSLAAQYDVNVIMFDYPSITTTKKSLGNYFFAMGNAHKAYRYFLPAIGTIKDLQTAGKMGTGKLTLFYHSMGNHVARGIVKHHKLDAINDVVWVDNLVLNAPCVPRRGHKRWINQIKFAKRIYINYNNNDFTLGGAYLVSKKLQLGHRPIRNISHEANVNYINFNTLCGQGHSNFLTLTGVQVCKPRSRDLYSAQLHGNDVNVHDTTLFTQSHFKHIGWELKP